MGCRCTVGSAGLEGRLLWLQRMEREASLKLLSPPPRPAPPRSDPYGSGQLQSMRCLLRTTGGDCRHLVQQSLGQLMARMGLNPHCKPILGLPSRLVSLHDGLNRNRMS